MVQYSCIQYDFVQTVRWSGRDMMRYKIAVVTLSTWCNFSSFSKRKFNRGVKTTVSYTALSALHLTVICGGHLKRIYSEFVETMYDFKKFKQ